MNRGRLVMDIQKWEVILLGAFAHWCSVWSEGKTVSLPKCSQGSEMPEWVVSGDGAASSVHLHTGVPWGDMCTIITESFSVLLSTWDCQTSELNLLIAIAKPFWCLRQLKPLTVKSFIAAQDLATLRVGASSNPWGRANWIIKGVSHCGSG